MDRALAELVTLIGVVTVFGSGLAGLRTEWHAGFRGASNSGVARAVTFAAGVSVFTMRCVVGVDVIGECRCVSSVGRVVIVLCGLVVCDVGVGSKRVKLCVGGIPGRTFVRTVWRNAHNYCSGSKQVSAHHEETCYKVLH